MSTDKYIRIKEQSKYDPPVEWLVWYNHIEMLLGLASCGFYTYCRLQFYPTMANSRLHDDFLSIAQGNAPYPAFEAEREAKFGSFTASDSYLNVDLRTCHHRWCV